MSSSPFHSYSGSSKPCNVQVIVRCRPQNSKEAGHPIMVKTDSLKREVRVQQILHGKPFERTFTFDYAYGPKTTQEELFSRSIIPIVEEVLMGYNCTIFAYGQTSTGKTFTMEGEWAVAPEVTPETPSTPSINNNNTVPRIPSTPAATFYSSSSVLSPNAGVIPRAVHHIFSTLENANTEYTVKVSCLELYNEELSDLLTTQKKPLRIFDDSTGRKGTVVSNLEEVIVRNTNDIFQVLTEASTRRRIAETQMNKHSSRSHLITTVTIIMKESTPDGEDLIKIGKLNLVDLAGSENIGRSGAVNQRAKEAGMINTSLLTLGRVITALTENSPHIPYRESKLTRLLQDSLGGKTKTCIIATISPSQLNLEETMSTLDYAHRAKNIKNRPELNQKMTKRALIKEMAADVEKLKLELQAAREKSGVYQPLEIYQEKEALIEKNGLRIKELEEEVDLKQGIIEELKRTLEIKETEYIAEVENHEQTKTELATTQTQLQKAETELKEAIEALNENEYVLGEYKATECVLYEEAESLLDNLRESIDDIDKLHSKVEIKDKVSEENRKLATDFQKSVSEKVGQVESKMGDYQKQQLSILDNLRNSIGTLTQEKTKEVDGVKNELQELLASYSKSQQSIKDVVAQYAARTKDSMSTLSGKQEPFMQQINELLDDMNKGVSTIVAVAAQKLQKEQQELVELKTTIEAGIASGIANMEKYAEEHSKMLRDLQSLIDTNASMQLQSISSQRSSLAEFGRQQKEQSQKMKEDIMSQIASLLDSAFAQQDSLRDSVLGGLEQQWQADIQGTESFKSQFATAKSNFDDKLSSYKESLTKEHQQQSQYVKDKYMTMDALMQEARVDVTKIQSTCENSSASITSALTQHKNLVQSLVDVEMQEVQQFADRHDKAISESSEQFKSSHGRSLTKIARIGDMVDAHSSSMLQHTSKSQSTVESYLSAQYQQVGSIRKDVDVYINSLKQDKSAPVQKRQFVLPERLTKTRPYEEIIAEYRNGGAATASAERQPRIGRAPTSPTSKQQSNNARSNAASNIPRLAPKRAVATNNVIVPPSPCSPKNSNHNSFAAGNNGAAANPFIKRKRLAAFMEEPGEVDFNSIEVVVGEENTTDKENMPPVALM